MTYVNKNADSKRDGKRIMDNIDRQIVFAVANYQGRNFKQWTGNDSKALMKVGYASVSLSSH
jgi:hypothetical protein